MNSADPYAPIAPEAATDEPSTAGDLHRVRTGVSLVFYGLMLWVICMLAALPQAMLLAVVPPLGFVVIAFFSLLLFGSAAMAFVGRIFCLSAPEQGGRSLIYAAVSFDVLAMLMTAATWLFVVPPLLSLLSGVFILVANILFVLFLKSLANLLERRDQAERALLVLKLGVAEIIAIVGFFVGLLIELPVLYLPCGMLLLPMVLAQLIYYTLLLWDLKNILQSRSPSPSASLA